MRASTRRSREVEFILHARLIAQGLDRPIRDEADYPELFKRLQPVSPIAMTYPGNPPALVKRTAFDSGEASDDLRGDRKLVELPISYFLFCETWRNVGKAACRLRGPVGPCAGRQRRPSCARSRPQGHAKSTPTGVRATNKGLQAHAWPRRLGGPSISLWQK